MPWCESIKKDNVPLTMVIDDQRIYICARLIRQRSLQVFLLFSNVLYRMVGLKSEETRWDWKYPLLLLFINTNAPLMNQFMSNKIHANDLVP